MQQQKEIKEFILHLLLLRDDVQDYDLQQIIQDASIDGGAMLVLHLLGV